MILDCEIDFEVHIILGRPFLEIGKALVDMEIGELVFWLNNEEFIFNIFQSMKQSRDVIIVSIIDIIGDGVTEVPIEERFVV